MRIAVGITAGAVLATAVALVGLYLFGVLVLHGKGSLFDASRSAENTFFVIWVALTAAFAILGGYAGYANDASRKKK
ncbi:hypothetical protein [Paraburkholderia sp. RAU2J]|uniref:hypothetical protein n=1 Tax=Paraburkholderia sp. RAU2J TaxID=1938810 RepID=UPI0011C36DFE|nr:hypothetical protein [Paraburkholderia sp. RAU2J]